MAHFPFLLVISSSPLLIFKARAARSKKALKHCLSFTEGILYWWYLATLAALHDLRFSKTLLLSSPPPVSPQEEPQSIRRISSSLFPRIRERMFVPFLDIER